MASLVSSSLLLDVIGVIVAIIAVIYTWFKWSYGHWKRKNVPYIEPSFPFGNVAKSMAIDKISFTDRTLGWYKFGKENKYKHFGLYFIKSPVLLVMDLENIKNILTTDFEHWVDRGNYVNEEGDPLSAHLLNIGGEKWKNLRKKFTPTFTSGKMKQMFKTIADCSVSLDRVMEEKLKENKPLDIKTVAGNFTTDVIGSCALGLECGSFKEEDSLFRVYGKRVFDSNHFDFMKMIFVNAWPEFAKSMNLKIIPADVTNFFLSVVKNTVKYRRENNVTRKDFLQILIDMEKENYDGAGNSLTMNEMAAQALAFFVAGFESSATTMTFTLFEMSQHQDVQDRVRQEVNEVLAKHNGEINYESIMEMKYMTQVIQEALRKYPPIPDVSRRCVKEYKVPGTDLVLEEGTLAFIPIVGIHYDEDYYPNPTKFNPERFSHENKQKIKPFSYMPFGGGRRVCIGERFGLLQVKVGLTTFLKKYRYTLNKQTQLPLKMNPLNFITTVKGDVWLNYEKI
ncbi:unnamed protein product [Brassicogethes aeneus]|uniref:Cytochrome P450 n=1 Tax=Brassicogethes aeneus TaxID=1431903 RepID=A0A9P0FFR4_BRAAE|nr:unnamed protein product [Brassicogethes aeneus]